MKPNDRKLIIVLACVLVVTFFTIWNSQVMNLHRIQKHIDGIAPKWKEFQDQNIGFEDVRFMPFTGGGGMFSAYGKVGTEEDLAKLKKFIESTNSPRPIYLRSIRIQELDEKIQLQYNK